jgi:heat shock protein HtpX
MNNVKVFVLMAGLTALLVALGGAFGGSSGATIMVAVSAVMNLAMYWGSSSMVLRAYGAQVVTAAEAPELYAMVDRLRQRAGLPMPTVAIAPQAQPNAFATGRNPSHAAIAVTDGIMRILDREELEGVLAHEMSHVINRDVLIGTIAATLAGAITYLAHMAQWAAFMGGGRHDDDDSPSPIAMIAMAVIAPIAAMLVQLAVSRSREFHADATGARLAGQPWPLAKALEKLDMASRAIPMNANPATAHMFIMNPLRGQALMRLFSTHPSTEERIARLRAMRTR